jgi:hypothetical protein
MASDKQIRANRRNAQKSTGPKTPEGKDAVRLNATKHGLRSQEVLLPEEDGEALKELDENLRAELQPVGELENLLVDGIVAAHWRLRRLRRVEAGIFSWELYGELAERAQQEARTYESNMLVEIGDPLDITMNEQKHQEALSKAQEMKQVQQDGETTPTPSWSTACWDAPKVAPRSYGHKSGTTASLLPLLDEQEKP